LSILCIERFSCRFGKASGLTNFAPLKRKRPTLLVSGLEMCWVSDAAAVVRVQTSASLTLTHDR